MICRLSGSPAESNPQGTTTAGTPASAAGALYARRVKNFPAASSRLLTVEVASAIVGAARCPVGASSRSKRVSAARTSRRSAARARVAICWYAAGSKLAVRSRRRVPWS